MSPLLFILVIPFYVKMEPMNLCSRFFLYFRLVTVVYRMDTYERHSVNEGDQVAHFCIRLGKFVLVAKPFDPGLQILHVDPNMTTELDVGLVVTVPNHLHPRARDDRTDRFRATVRVCARFHLEE